MATKPSETDSKSDTAGRRDTIITPAGPLPREKVHQVRPGEVVRRKEDGSLIIEPARKGDEPTLPK